MTGSFIRRTEGISAASPVVSYSAEDIESQGTIDMAQVVQNLTFNNGTSVSNSIQGVTNQIASFNLRGLGERATLPLIDGKRVPTLNVQQLLPTMALQRMDIVTDGAAALYGTDAVAGVVNMVPYKSYDGFKLEYYEEGDSRGDYRKNETSFLAGSSFGDVDIVVAGSYQNGGTLAWHERPEWVKAGLTHNSGSNPGNFEVPQRDADGNLTGAFANRADPNCGLNEDPNQATFGTSPWGTNALGRCWLSFGDTRDFMEAIDSTSLYGNISWDASADLTLSAQMMYNRQVVRGRENPGNPGARVADLPTVRGELPGNTFRATNSEGQPLFAQPLRDGNGNIVTDGFGQPLPMRNSDGVVVLANNQFSSLDDDPLGGIPFREDVRIGAWLPFGKIEANTQPAAFAANDGLNIENDDKRTMRFSLTADFTVPFVEGWEGTSYYTYGQERQQDLSNQSFTFDAVVQGLNCDVVNDVDSCFNPFAAVDPQLRTPQHVADAVFNHFRNNDLYKLQTFDVIVNGDLPLGGFELPGGAIAAAIGYQRRDETQDNNPPANFVANNQLIGTQVLPNKANRFSNSWFAEFSFPLLSNLELTAAVRDESYSTGQGKVIDKYGIIYRANDMLNLRLTSGEAFIVPTLTQLFRPESCGLSNVDDLFTTFSGFITSCITGNQNLSSETSESISAGFDLTLFDDLVWSVTWSETDFTDRIVSTTTQDIVRSDFRNFQEATGFMPTDANPYPSVAQLEAWVADPRSDKRIIRSPNDITTTVRINQSDSNASSMLVQAWDTQLSYGFSLSDIGLGDWGDILLNLQATYTDSYQFQLSADDPVLEAVGNQNNDYGAVPAIPKIRSNFRVAWTLGQHSVSATARYVDEVDFDANEFSFQQFLPGSTWQSTDVINAWSQMDAFYSYSGLEMWDGEFNFTVGARNLFDRMPQKVGMIAGVEAQLQDALGRVVYARVNYNF
ncbi:MAG: TonB-dependent receptor plug domain-containing protein [Pseudomonadales bacterium]|nr:TonB-dependent receptor plug domain-containing protein [Pseudomonadales bacterium]